MSTIRCFQLRRGSSASEPIKLTSSRFFVPFPQTTWLEYSLVISGILAFWVPSRDWSTGRVSEEKRKEKRLRGGPKVKLNSVGHVCQMYENDTLPHEDEIFTEIIQNKFSFEGYARLIEGSFGEFTLRKINLDAVPILILKRKIFRSAYSRHSRPFFPAGKFTDLCKQ